jgi:hypothetical protein
MTGPKDRASRVQVRDGDSKGTSYRDNRDGTIHVTDYDGDTRTSYDVDYGQNADDRSQGRDVHTTKQ